MCLRLGFFPSEEPVLNNNPGPQREDEKERV